MQLSFICSSEALQILVFKEFQNKTIRKDENEKIINLLKTLNALLNL